MKVYSNDADGVVNGRIVDPLGVGVPTASPAISASSGGGGSFGFKSLLLVLLMLLLKGYRSIVRKEEK